MAEPLSEERLREIRERADAATPGPWYAIHDDDGMFMNCYAVSTNADADPSDPSEPFVAGCLVQSEVIINPGDRMYAANTAFIAAAREDVPALLAERDRLAALLAEAEALLRDAAAHGELDQYRAGWKAGLEDAARLVEELNDVPQSVTLGKTANAIRTLARVSV